MKNNTNRLAVVAVAGVVLGCLGLARTEAAYPAAVLDMDPVAYWRLEATGAVTPEVAVNTGSVGAAGNGVYIGAPKLQQPGALAAGGDPAAEFSGAGMLMQVPHTAALNPNAPFTIEAWVKPNVALTGTALTCPVASLRRVTPAAEGWIIYQTPTAWNFRLGDSVNNYTLDINSTSGVTPGQWVHLVATYDGNTATLYINGVAEVSATTANYAPNPSVPFGIGARGDNSFHFNGVVDEVALYPSALSAAQVQAHFENGTSASPAQPYSQLVQAGNPLGYWRLNDAPTRLQTVNLGSLGTDANGVYQVGSSPGVPGPRPAFEPGFEAGNVAVDLDGNAGFVMVNQPLNLNSDTVTLTGWIQPFSPQVEFAGVIFARGGTTVAGINFFGATGALGYHWNDTPGSYNWSSGLIPSDNIWNFIALVIEPTRATMYLHDGFGLQSAVNAIAHAPEEFNGPLRLGLDSGTRFFRGGIDEVAIFNRALSAGEIQTLAYAGFGSTLPPEILTQPTAPAHPIYEGGSFTLSVDASGVPPLTYQWRRNGVNIAGATDRVLTVENATAADSGSYSVVVGSASGSTPSVAVTITVLATTIPVITQQPVAVTVYEGGRARFTVAASGSVDFDYQWRHQGADLPGETSATLLLSGVQTGQAGDYSVVVSNSAGSTPSAAATLNVIELTPGSYPHAVMADDPVAFWRLGETTGTTAFDYAGGFHGEYLNDVLLGQPGALVDDPNAAAGFEQTTQTKVEVPFASDLNQGQFTVELWAKVAAGSGDYRSPLTSRDDAPQRGYIFYATPGNVWEFWTGTGTGWNSLAGGPVQVETWTHLVGTYDGTVKRFYVNGNLVGENTSALGLNTAQVLRIGGGATESSVGNYFFAGDIDEVAVYDTALSPERIQLHYGAGLGASTPPAIAQQPGSQAVLEGESVTFTVQATGSLPLSYQWQFNGANIPGATSDTLTLTGVEAANGGDYRVVVQNPAGTATSSSATLSVVVLPAIAYQQAILNDNPVAYWRLGEASGTLARDERGIYHGDYLNGVALGRPGALHDDANTAAGFAAAAQTKVEVPWTWDLNEPTFTIEAWAKATGGVGTYRSPVTSRADGPQRGYIFYAANNNLWQFWTGTGAQTGWNIISGPPVVLDEWVHLVGTHDGTTKRFYVNGRLVGQNTSEFGINDLHLLRIGGGASENPVGQFFFEGDVDEVAYYSRALSPEQILIHYGLGRPPMAPPTLAIDRTAAGIVVTWENGVLQQAEAVTGPFTDVNATSPLTIEPAGTRLFLRVRQ